ELLPGFYGDWIFPEQQRLEELYFQSLRQLIECLTQAGDLDRALQVALRSVSAGRLREEAHQEVIKLYISTGQTPAALRQYQELERILRTEMEAAPSDRSSALLLEIQHRDRPHARVNAAKDRSDREAADRAELTASAIRSEQLEPAGGAVALTSRFYVCR